MAELAKEVLARMSTPDRVESRLGTLEFSDGAPSAKTVETLYDHLDFVHALNAFLTAFPAASTQAIRQGFLDVGVEDNTCLIFSELMDSSSRFLTANADTVYYLVFVDLNDGPMVVETPPMALGTFDDMWFQWIIDFGLPGPDRGAGGKFLLVPPGYDGTLPEGGFFVGHSRTNRVLMLGRSFMEDNDPAPTVATIKSTLKVYPYAPGGPGTSVGTLLRGGPLPAPPVDDPRDHVRRGKRPDVQHDPADRLRVLRDGQRAAPGRGRRRHRPRDPRAPRRDRHRQGQAVRARRPDATRSSTTPRPSATRPSRALMFDARGEEDVAWYPGSAWTNMLFGGGYLFETADPGGHARRHQAVSRRPVPASTTCARCSSTATPASRRRWPCASPGSGASTSSRSSTRTRSTSTARSRTR